MCNKAPTANALRYKEYDCRMGRYAFAKAPKGVIIENPNKKIKTSNKSGLPFEAIKRAQSAGHATRKKPIG